MSVRASNWVWENAPVKSGNLVVLLALADVAHDDGTGAFPSRAHLAKKSRMTVRQVSRCLADLQEKGLIYKQGEMPGGVVIWALNMGGDILSPPATDATGGGTPTSGAPGSQCHPEPSVEPSSNRQKSEAARAKAQQVPEDFPPSLRDHARIVYRLLKDVAEQHNAREVTPRAVCLVIMGNPGRRYVEEAHALAAWAQSPPRPIKDVVGTYRTWLNRANIFAGVEPLKAEDMARLPENVRRLPQRGSVVDRNMDRAQRWANDQD